MTINNNYDPVFLTEGLTQGHLFSTRKKKRHTTHNSNPFQAVLLGVSFPRIDPHKLDIRKKHAEVGLQFRNCPHLLVRH